MFFQVSVHLWHFYNYWGVLLTFDRCPQSLEGDFNTTWNSSLLCYFRNIVRDCQPNKFFFIAWKIFRVVCSRNIVIHIENGYIVRHTITYRPMSFFFVHSVPVQGGQAIPLYLEAILVMLSSLSTALQQEKEFINVIWWVHKYFKLTNGQSFPTLFQKFSIRNLDQRIMAIFTGT